MARAGLKSSSSALRVACALGVAFAAASPVLARDWWIGRSAHFEVWSGASERETQEIVDQIELFRAVVLQRTRVEKLEPQIPTTLVIFDKAREFAPVRPRRGVAGFFQAAVHRNFLVVDASRPLEAVQIAQHEFGHFVLASATRLSAPAWYHEGFAELLSTVRRDGDVIVVGEAPPERLRMLVGGNTIPLARVLGGTEVLRWSNPALSAFYAQSWLLTHYLHWGAAVGFSDRSKQMLEYLSLVDRGVDVETACTRAFGVSIEQLEKETLAYLAKGKLAYQKLPAKDIAAPRGIALARLSGADRDALLADLALAIGDEAFGAAEKWLTSALRAQPDHALALSSRAWLAAAREDDDAGGWIARARALAPSDAGAKRRIADALVRHVARAPEALDQALALYTDALGDEATQAAALVGIAHVAQERGQLDVAIEGLVAARNLLPAFDRLDYELAQLYVAVNRVDEARSSLRRVLARSHDSAAIAVDLSGFETLLKDVGFPDEGALATRHLTARLDVDAPEPGADTARIPLSEVRGRAGLWESAFHDVVIVLDESGSTFAASGSDIDGDGSVGRTIGNSGKSTDPGDSIFSAERVAAARLAEQFDTGFVRVGLVGFWHDRVVHAALGAPEVLLGLLRNDAVHQPRDGGATSIALGLIGAFEELIKARDPNVRRQRTILLLSDGIPTMPSPKLGEKQALELADRLAEYGIRVHAFALGKEALEGTDAFREIAARTGGKFVPVAQPADVVSFLREVSLTGLEGVTVRNLTTKRPGRGVRTFPDGSFDAFVELAPGENQIEVSARVEGREPLVVVRSVTHSPAPKGDPVAESELAQLVETLRLRNTETQLVRRARAARAQQPARAGAEPERSAGLRSVEIRVLPEDAEDGASREAGAED